MAISPRREGVMVMASATSTTSAQSAGEMLACNLREGICLDISCTNQFGLMKVKRQRSSVNIWLSASAYL